MSSWKKIKSFYATISDEQHHFFTRRSYVLHFKVHIHGIYLFIDHGDSSWFDSHSECHADMKQLVEEYRLSYSINKEQTCVDITLPGFLILILCVTNQCTARQRCSSYQMWAMIIQAGRETYCNTVFYLIRAQNALARSDLISRGCSWGSELSNSGFFLLKFGQY